MQRVIIASVVLYLLAIAYLYFAQESLIFKKQYAKPYIPLKAEVISFQTSDGITLEGSFVKHGKDLPLVLYFGGNASNVLYFLDNVATKIKNYNFIAFNYPGYGNSKGTPSQENILKYALEITKKYKPDILIGRSLGTAVASYVTSKIAIKKLVLITPFDSIESIAQNRYPIFPIKLLLKHPFRELEYLKNSKASTINALFVQKDEVIPKKSIENLQKSIEFNRSITIDASHNWIYEYPTIDKIIKKLLE